MRKKWLWAGLLILFALLLALLLVAESSAPEATITSVPSALWYLLTTLTTVGYGDICPTSDIGRVISMLSALLGVAVIALPSGVITASYLEELREMKKAPKDEVKDEEEK